jgi:hypothetical protein
MKITYLPEKQDFINAQLTHGWRKHSPDARRTLRILLPLAGIVWLWLAYHLGRTGGNGAVVFVAAIFGLYLVLALSVISPILLSRAYRRSRPVTLSSITWTVDAESLRCSNPGSGQVELQWSTIRGYIDWPTTLLMYTAPGVFLYFPKRVLSDAHQAELLALLSEHAIPPGYPR